MLTRSYGNWSSSLINIMTQILRLHWKYSKTKLISYTRQLSIMWRSNRSQRRKKRPLKTKSSTSLFELEYEIDAYEDRDAPYCLKDFSKIDIVIAPLMERINCLLLYYKNEDLHWNFDIISRYMDAMERRPAYRATQSDIHTHAYNLPAYIGRC